MPTSLIWFLGCFSEIRLYVFCRVPCRPFDVFGRRQGALPVGVRGFARAYLFHTMACHEGSHWVNVD